MVGKRPEEAAVRNAAVDRIAAEQEFRSKGRYI